MTSYITIADTAQAEIIEKKSRFIGQCAHVETEEEALAFLESVRTEHRMARHNVFAYVLREGNRVRYSDDGEPQKTAGLPTLEVIQHKELSDIIVVVTRYFGGVLLGTGGLVRAYTQATQAALEQAHLLTVSRCIEITIDAEYSWYDQLLHIAQEEQAQVVDTQFTDKVCLTLRMLENTEGSLLRKLQEISHGENVYRVSEAFDAVFNAN